MNTGGYTPRNDFQVGEKARFTKKIEQRDIELMAEISGDCNPLHLDPAFAERSRFKGTIAHGVLTASVVSAALGMKLPGPGGIYLSQTISFLLPVRPGDEVTAEVEVEAWNPDKGVIHLATRCSNQNGEEVLTGKAVFMIDRTLFDSPKAAPDRSDAGQ
jgi:acyl dehydratase